MILADVALDQLGELGGASGHGTLVLLLSVVGLRLSLELLNNLILLPQLEVDLAQFILQDRVQVRLFLVGSILLLLLLFFLLRD